MSATEEAEPIGTASVGGQAVIGPTGLPAIFPAPSPMTPSVPRRVVAIAPDAVELLRPASDLARLLTSFGRADVLLAAETVPMTAADEDSEEDLDDWADDGPDPVRAAVGELGHPDLVVHRLGLASPLRPDTEHDLVAAMSELVGFDPEPLVYCLAPAAPLRGALARAVERIAQVYGLPVLRYRCLELSLVDPWDPEEGDLEQ